VRSETVPTNLSCNENCTFCNARRASDDRAWILGAAVRARIDGALARKAEEIILSGGEPAMRSDLDKLIEYARSRGASRTVLETNGTLVTPERAERLRQAGLALARVHLPGCGDGLDAVTRQPGSWTLALNGVRSLTGAGIPVEIAVTVVRSSLPLVPLIPTRLRDDLGSLDGIRAFVVRVPVESPDEKEIVSYADAARAILSLEAAARGVRIPVRMAPDSGPPPCLFPGPAASLFSLSPGAPKWPNHRKVEACASCQINDRCSGFPEVQLARFPDVRPRPVTEDRFRRRLTLAGPVEDQIDRELVRSNRRRSIGESEVLDERLIRVNFHCNQACRFCFVPTHLPPPREQAVREAITTAGAEGARIMLTGGEPTLNANLPDYIRLARQHSPHPVGLQTNAIRAADPAYARSLVEAGLHEVAVSLHGSTAEISDAITEAPGTFDRTVVGLDNLYATGVQLDLTFVICRRNASDISSYVRLVGDRWPSAWVNIAFVSPSSDLVPRDADLIPRYSEVVPHLVAGLREAEVRGVYARGFESMCGIPLCLVPEDVAEEVAGADDTDGYENGTFVKTEACTRCALESQCYGLRRGYFDMYGADELRPVKALASTDAAVARLSSGPQVATPGAVIYAGGQCARRCAPCDCSHPPSTPEEIRRVLALRPGRVIVRGATEGSADLANLIRQARSAGVEDVVVRTSASAYRNPAAAAALAGAGVQSVLVPIFSHVPAVFDRIAGHRSALADTLAGMAALAQAGLGIELEVPILNPRLQRLPALVERVHEKVPGLRKIWFVASAVDLPRALAPEPWNIATHNIARALARGAELGLRCFVAEDLARRFRA
jgi:MoaA/NifB/PqqE/SkfB family radical SAM enzyme